jgi:hypothetical protein
MATEEQMERVKALVKKAVQELGEHVDTVRIFVTVASDDDSHAHCSYTQGGGNFYAQRGQVQEWLIREDEQCRIEERKDAEAD